MSKIRGDIGEHRISGLLNGLNYPDYMVGNNLSMLDDKGKRVQFDHLILSKYGIFVVETKNLAGKVSGFPKDKYWVQRVNGRVFKLYNPFRQNYFHDMALRSILNLDTGIYTIVCFTERSELSNILKNSKSIVRPLELIDWIESFQSELFSQKELLLIRDILTSRNRHLYAVDHRHTLMMSTSEGSLRNF